MDRTPDPAGTNRDDRSPGEDGSGRAASGAPGRSPEQAPAGDRKTPAAQRAGIDPSLDEHRGRGISGAMWTALILGLLILVLLLVFILQNNVPADFEYMTWRFRLPLGVAMLLAAVAGALVMALVGSVRLFTLGHRLRRLEKEREDIKRALRRP